MHPKTRSINWLWLIPILLIVTLGLNKMGNAAYIPDSRSYPIQEDAPTWRDHDRKRNIQVKIYAPDPSVTTDNLPIVVFSPGFGESREGYAYLGRHLARQGYITVVVNHAGSDTTAYTANGWAAMAEPGSFVERPRDLSFVIDRITADDQSNLLLRDRVDVGRIGVAGHSMGSTTALALVGLAVNTPNKSGLTFTDRRVRAAVVLSPQVDTPSGLTKTTGFLGEHSWDHINVPVLLMTGSRDFGVSRQTRSNPDARHIVFERIPGEDTYYMNIDGAAHHAFSDTDPFYPGGVRDPRHHGWINIAVTAFFDAYLVGDRNALEWLQNKSVSDATDGRVSQEQKLDIESRQQSEIAVVNQAGPIGSVNFEPLTRFIEKGLRERSVPGAGMLIIDKTGKIYYEKYFGNWSETKAVPIASASKWWAAVTIMTLVDQGLISLDDPVAKYLPEFRSKGKKSDITVRQTLAFTTGYIHHHARQDDPSISQEDLVRFIAGMDLQQDPGTAFIYGGLQMEITGRVAEVVTGKPYRQVFQEQLLEPLNADNTRIANMVKRRPDNLDFESSNPLVPGGVVTNLADYRKFILMLLNDGDYNGKRILSSQAIREMTHDQTGGVPILRTPQEDHTYRYSLGAWHRIIDPRTNEVIVSSGGALGTSPWINLKGHYGVVFITRARAGQLQEFIWRLKDMVTDTMNGKVISDQSADMAASRKQAAVPGEGVDRLLKRFDRNHDNKLSRREISPQMVRLSKAFNRLDRNHDGDLSAEELEVVVEFARGHSEQAKPKTRISADRTTNDDAEIDMTGIPLSDDSYQAVASGLSPAAIDKLILHDEQRAKNLQLRITYPQGGGSYPVIIFSHYAGGTREYYEPLARYWASHGYVCIQPDHSDSPAMGGQRGREARQDWKNRPLDVSFIIDSLDEIARQAPVLAGKIDEMHIGVGGHYLGAYTANLVGGMRVFSGSGDKSPDFRDTRVGALALLSPQGTGQGVTEDSWATLDMPMLVMTGSNDRSTRTDNSARWRTEPYQFSPSGDKYLLYIEGLASDYGGILGKAATGATASSLNTAHLDYTQISTLAFWDAYLKDSEPARQLLRSDQLETRSGGAIELSWK